MTDGQQPANQQPTPPQPQGQGGVPTPPPAGSAQQGAGSQPASQQPPASQVPPQQASAGQQPPVAQPGSTQPTGGQPQPPQGGAIPTPPTPPTPPQPPVPQDPNARVGQLKKKGGHTFTIPPHPNTQFDEANFLELLEGSISLTFEEKQRVIDAIPRLSIEQINELISIFEEEKTKFAELEKEFAGDVQKLKQEREKELEVQELKQEEAGSADEDAAAAEALKKQMGL